MSNTQAITLKLSQELLEQIQDIAGSTDINEFLIIAIKSEIQRHQNPQKKITFGENLNN